MNDTRSTIDLFDVETTGNYKDSRGLSPGTRSATDNEIVAYARWLAWKSGAPDLCHATVEREGWSRKNKNAITNGVTFGAMVRGPLRAGDYEPPQYEDGAYSIPLHGKWSQQIVVTMETLDDDGNLISSSTMPVEPKKQGIVWDRETVRKACGPVAKVKAKKTAAPVSVESDICAGPMWKGEPWSSVFSDVDRWIEDEAPMIRIDCVDGTYSIVNKWTRKGTGQRTRIPRRHNETAKLLFERQLFIDKRKWGIADGEEARQMPASDDFEPAAPMTPPVVEKALSGPEIKPGKRSAARARIVRQFLAMRKQRNELREWSAYVESEFAAVEARALKAETALAAMQARLDGWPPAVASIDRIAA